ncbi:hypothetical protein [Alistipes putredinis]|uniref:hypothetical protein n=1 Tax=Alistipes putredinis TaxID=28117 RepID=UPI003AB7D7B3
MIQQKAVPPFDGAEYDYYTTAKGILEKVRAHAGDVDFEVLMRPRYKNMASQQ